MLLSEWWFCLIFASPDLVFFDVGGIETLTLYSQYYPHPIFQLGPGFCHSVDVSSLSTIDNVLGRSLPIRPCLGGEKTY